MNKLRNSILESFIRQGVAMHGRDSMIEQTHSKIQFAVFDFAAVPHLLQGYNFVELRLLTMSLVFTVELEDKFRNSCSAPINIPTYILPPV